MTTRRTFLAAAAAGTAFAGTTRTFRYSEIETRIARRDFRGITKEDLGTPALMVDRALLERNLSHMSGHCRDTGISLRAHCKIHKSVDIAQRQVALGSLGICCATIAECELMVGAGIRNVLHTCQPAGKNKIWRAVELAAQDPTFMVVADDPLTVDLLDQAAAARRIKMTLLPDIYAGLTRHGMAPGDPGVALAKRIDSSKNLRLGGLMAYSGVASHTHGWETRREQSRKDVTPMIETAAACRKAGLNTAILTGGSTGTYNIDGEIGLTELQAGSFVFMDTAYMKIGGKSDATRYGDFQPSLTVLTTVISRNHPNQATIDAGNKAMLRPTDQVKDRPDMVIENQGAEYGILRWKDGDELKLGQRLELYTSNLDMTTNCYDRYYVCDGENVVDVWPIMGRSGAVQR
ncbi:MAG: alanine racemase [Acidobacteria bacterium]|nr:alanine racemase [Acidobacteriota bacterium]